MQAIETSDRDLAAHALGESFPGLELTEGAHSASFHFFHAREQKGFITRSRMDVRGRIRTVGFYPDDFAVIRRLEGKIAIEYGNESLNTSLSYLRPRGHSDARFEDSRAELLSFEPEAFRCVASRHLEGTGQRLRLPTADRATPSPEGDRLWNAAADIIGRGDGTSALRVTVLQDLAVTTLLIAFPLTEDASAPSGTNLLPRAVRRACGYVDEHLGEPISIPQIADAARVSVRSLEYGFRRAFGVTPSVYLRNARLRGAHEDLLSAEPDQVTVAAIARKWAFANAGRFAALYRARFGEGPSETLHR